MAKKFISMVIITSIFMLLILPLVNGVKADDIKVVVSLGANLTEEEKQEMIDYMNVNKDEVKLIQTTNKEEAEYLKNTPAIDHIGKITISSAYVEQLDEGQGISVDTHNISWVSEEMYANAMVTAGVKDAKVIAAAPYEVSGTGALTGIMKAFEEITGKKLDEDAKRVANEEMVVTGELGEELGNQDQASELVKRVKERIIEEGITDSEGIKRIIIEIQQDLNINLNEAQMQQLIKLMEKIKNIDINIEDLKNQVIKIGERAKEFAQDNQEVKSLLQRIGDLISQLIQSIMNIFN